MLKQSVSVDKELRFLLHSLMSDADEPVPCHLAGQQQCIKTALEYFPAEDNVVLSPFSLISCMAMLLRGATASAQAELAPYCCHSSVSDEELTRFVAQLSGSQVCQSVNILMSDRAMLPRYRAEMIAVFASHPFTLSNEDTASVNALVQRVTKMQTAVLNRAPEATTLINAIRFADTWCTQFSPHTTRRTFHLQGGAEAECDMMSQTSDLPVLQMRDMTAVHLGYQTKDFGAWFVKDENPCHQSAYIALQLFLKQNWWDPAAIPTKRVELDVPKFDIEYNIDLLTMLLKTDKHKVEQIFEAGSLTNMSTDASEKISRFTQECVLKVSQSGTEAAARTVAGATRGAVERYEAITFDHTFYMVIYFKRTILFVAKIANPTPSGQTGTAQPGNLNPQLYADLQKAEKTLMKVLQLRLLGLEHRIAKVKLSGQDLETLEKNRKDLVEQVSVLEITDILVSYNSFLKQRIDTKYLQSRLARDGTDMALHELTYVDMTESLKRAYLKQLQTHEKARVLDWLRSIGLGQCTDLADLFDNFDDFRKTTEANFRDILPGVCEKEEDIDTFIKQWKLRSWKNFCKFL